MNQIYTSFEEKRPTFAKNGIGQTLTIDNFNCEFLFRNDMYRLLHQPSLTLSQRLSKLIRSNITSLKTNHKTEKRKTIY